MLSDPEIQALIEDVKPLSSTILKEIQLKNKENRAYKEYELEVKSKSGKIFRIRIRANTINIMDFSVILIYVDENKKYHAQITDSYNNWKDALTKMLKDCNFKGDMSLFNSYN